MADSSIFSTAINIFASPSEAFPVIKERPRALFPWALIVLGIGAVSLLYINLVDLGWYLEEQIRASNASGQMTDEQIVQAAERAGSTPPMLIGSIAAVSSGIVVTLIFFVYSLYLTGVSFVTGDGIRLKQWFALVCWCTLPTLLGYLASIVNLLTSDASLMPQQRINPLSFSSLFSLEAGGSTFSRILQNYDLTAIWALVLTVFGYQALSGKPLAKSALIALAPYILIIGVGLYASFG